MQRLIVVDSPAKVATLRPALEPGDEILAAVGPWRVLPPDFAADPASDFEPIWQQTPSARRQLKELREAAAGKARIVVVTNPGRAGAGTAWHLRELLDEEYRDRVCHVSLPEVSPRSLIAGLGRASSVAGQWKAGGLFRVYEADSIARSLLAEALRPLIGANQGLSWESVSALGLLCARERAITCFEPEACFALRTLFECDTGRFSAHHHLDAESSALDEQAAAAAYRRVASEHWVVACVKKRQYTERPAPAFTTASLFHAAFERLRFTADRTRAMAQRLYEGKPVGEAPPSGLITYWESGSSRVSAAASEAARVYLERVHGPQSVPARVPPAVGPQGEAVRPTVPDRDARSVADSLVQDEAALYGLIWERFIESQAKPEVVREVSVDLHVGPDRLTGVGEVILSPGFRLTPRATRRESLPALRDGQSVLLVRVERVPIASEPPQRYDDATLLDELIRQGLSQPGDLGALITSLEENDLAVRSGMALHPTRRGLRAVESLADRLPGLLDAVQMSEHNQLLSALESRATRRRLALRPLCRVLAGVGERRSRPRAERDRRSGLRCPECGKGVVVERPGRDGRPFHACDTYPRCRFRSAYPPSAGPCPDCGRALLFEKPTPRGGRVVFCSDRSCHHSHPA